MMENPYSATRRAVDNLSGKDREYYFFASEIERSRGGAIKALNMR
jgi:hypothetical protein